MDFEDFYKTSGLDNVLKLAKTLSKNEVEVIFNYFTEKRPKTIMEFGVQYGCSTRVFVEIAKYLQYEIILNSWDIVDVIKCVDRKDFVLHIEDVLGKEKQTIDKYKPDLLFLDAHPYYLTKNLMGICISDKIDFFAHDVSIKVYESAKKSSDNFTLKSKYCQWEPYLIKEFFSRDILTTNYYEDEKCIVSVLQDCWGLAKIEFKK